MNVQFTPGLPPQLSGACIFLLWDGSLCEGHLVRRGEADQPVLITYNLADPERPERIELRAGPDKVQGYALLTGHGKASQASPIACT